jgi:hypothetical protein
MAKSVRVKFQDIELPEVRGEIRFSNGVPILTIRHYLELDRLIEAKIKDLYNIPDDIYLKDSQVAWYDATQVNDALQQFNNITQQNAASSEELASTSEELASQAEQLKEMIDYFKV